MMELFAFEQFRSVVGGLMVGSDDMQYLSTPRFRDNVIGRFYNPIKLLI
jgi:hypothetical protein